ncbi:MAG: substrate-binding domain-containing protein [Phycisphaerae bacterium]
MAVRKRIAVLVSMETIYGLNILRGVARFVRATDDWDFVFKPWETDWQDYDPQALRNGCDGILCGLTRPRELELLRQPPCPIVSVLETHQVFDVCQVLPDQRAAGRLAAEHLQACGLRQFACCSHHFTRFTDLRVDGFVEAIDKADLPVRRYDHDTRLGGEWSLPAERRDIAAWLRTLPTPLGFFAASDRRGCQIVHYARELDIRVPEQLAVVGVDNIEMFCEFSHPPLSSVAMDHAQVGYQAASLLTDLLDGKATPPEPVLVPPRSVVARASTDTLAVDDPTVTAALRFIRTNACRGITIEDVLREVPVARRTLEKAFRRHLGRTPFGEIRRLQLQRAKALLADTDMAMPEVARIAGLRDGRYLSEVFRKELDVTPTAYRRQFRKA